jgi:3',5'-cyclic AMP phosphodiesterase CpdA
MRIAHISDIHVGCWTRDWTAFFDKRLLGQLNYYLRRRPAFRPEYLQRAVVRIAEIKPDLVVCTGDLTCVGSEEEFTAALSALNPLVDLPDCDLIYVPGNHDAYVWNVACEQSLDLAFRRLNRGRWGRQQLPQVLAYGDLRVFVLDECLPTNCLMSSGRLTPQAREGFEAWTSRVRQPGERRMMVGHFPIRDGACMPLAYRRRLFGADTVWQAMRASRVDVRLCGHVHTPFIRRDAGGTMEICAGSLTATGVFGLLEYTPRDGAFSHSWVSVA